MPLAPPNDNDRAKLHAEVNQYINQCFIIATTAITVSGVVLGLIVSGKDVGTGAPHVSETAFFLALVLLVILAVLFVVSQIIQASIRVITSYLRITGASPWEEMYAQFTKQSGQGKPVAWIGQREWMALIFGVLGAVATFTPFVLGGLLGAHQETKVAVLDTLLVVCFIAYESLILLSAKGRLLDLGKGTTERWRQLDAEIGNSREERG